MFDTSDVNLFPLLFYYEFLFKKSQVLQITTFPSDQIDKIRLIHPGLAENIAPVGGPGSDVIVEGIPP